MNFLLFLWQSTIFFCFSSTAHFPLWNLRLLCVCVGKKFPRAYLLLSGMVIVFLIFCWLTQDPKDTPPPTRAETRDERRERKRREKAEQVAYKLEQEIAMCKSQICAHYYRRASVRTEPKRGGGIGGWVDAGLLGGSYRRRSEVGEGWWCTMVGLGGFMFVLIFLWDLTFVIGVDGLGVGLSWWNICLFHCYQFFCVLHCRGPAQQFCFDYGYVQDAVCRQNSKYANDVRRLAGERREGGWRFMQFLIAISVVSGVPDFRIVVYMNICIHPPPLGGLVGFWKVMWVSLSCTRWRACNTPRTWVGGALIVPWGVWASGVGGWLGITGCRCTRQVPRSPADIRRAINWPVYKHFQVGVCPVLGVVGVGWVGWRVCVCNDSWLLCYDLIIKCIRGYFSPSRIMIRRNPSCGASLKCTEPCARCVIFLKI